MQNWSSEKGRHLARERGVIHLLILISGQLSTSIMNSLKLEVRVYDGQFNYPKTIFFEGEGGTKMINVEPGTAVHI